MDFGPYTEIVEYAVKHAPDTWKEIVFKVEIGEESLARIVTYQDAFGQNHMFYAPDLFTPESDYFYEMFERLQKVSREDGNAWIGIEFSLLPDMQYNVKFYYESMVFV